MSHKGADLKASPSSVLGLLTLARPHGLLAAGALVFLSLAAGTLLILGWGLRFVVDLLLAGNVPEDVIELTTLGLLGASFLIAASSFGRFVCVSLIEENVGTSLRQRLFEKTLGAPFQKIKAYSHGDLLIRFQEDISRIQEGIGRCFSVGVRSSIQLLGSLVLLLFTSTFLFFSVLMVTLCVLGPLYILGRRVRGKAEKRQIFSAQLLSFVEETWSQLLTVKLWGQEKRHGKSLKRKLEHSVSLGKQQIFARALLTSSVIFLVAGALSILFWVGGQSVLSESMSGGALASFIFYAVLAAGSVNSLSDVASTLAQSLGSLKRITELLSLPQQSEDTLSAPFLPSNKEVLLKVEDLSFRYPTQEKETLSGITLSLKQGSFTALVGPSGAGKTTLAQVILGVFAPTSGQILVQGHPLCEARLSSWWSKIGYVPQQPDLFDFSVKENILYGHPDADFQSVQNAAKQAHAHDFIQNLSQGYETDVGPRGENLSVGQKQRIYLARAFLRQPKLLILDEPTSALDGESEQHIATALLSCKDRSALLVIAHRLSTVQKADQVIVLNPSGRIEEVGTHESLLKGSALYQNLTQNMFLMNSAA
ncbi:MAG: ATP-binding cassette domain-containing protein [bacterium]|nr:ATP-binding cassette domain-containing protein [bacterium]